MFLPQLGLKGSSQLDQINDRLQYNPLAYEFYTDANDLILPMKATNASMMQFNTLKMLELKILSYITQ